MHNESMTQARRIMLARADARGETRSTTFSVRAPILSLRTPRRTHSNADVRSELRVEKLSGSRMWPFNLHLRNRRGVGRMCLAPAASAGRVDLRLSAVRAATLGRP